MATQTCLVSATPLTLPIRPNPVIVNGLGQARGIAVTLGNPSQFFSMRPALSLNNTFVANINQCDNANYSCIAEHGGVYNVPDNAIVTNNLNDWNGTRGVDVENGVNTYFNDLMTLQGKSIPGLPFYTYQPSINSSISQTTLALGSNSSFLQAAVDAAIIPSKQWAYWAGDQNIDEDGHVIFGGYDKNRVRGDLTSFSMTRKVVRVQISSLVWTDGDGNATDLLEGSGFSSLNALLEPYVDVIELPLDVAVNFAFATNATADTVRQLITYQSLPVGDLTVTLSTGFVVTVPSQSLFDRGVSYDSRGNYNNETNDFWVPKFSSYSRYPDLPLFLGAPFLSQQYLVVDYDDDTFYLGEAVVGAGSAVDVEPLCTAPAPPGRKTNVAAIAGGVGGGVGGLLVLLLILFLFLRHRRRTRKVVDPQPPEVVTNDMPQSPPPPRYLSGVPTFAEKDGVSSSGNPVSDTGTTKTMDGGELPSPNTEFSTASRFSSSNQGYQIQSHESSQGYYEMPSERY